MSSYKDFIGGSSAGLVSTLVCHPMDLLKIRYSVNDNSKLRPQYSSYLDATRKIFRAEGIRGLYQGLSPNLLASPIAWGLFFQGYNLIRPHFNFLDFSPSFQNLTVGCVAGGSVLAIISPLFVAKTRLCLQYETDGPKKYRGLTHCLAKIYRDEGVRGWYKGFVPGLWGSLYNSIQFAIYNHLKAWRCRQLGVENDTKLSTTDIFVFSAASKCLGKASIYPYQVVRARLQDHHTHYKSATDVIVQTLRKEGIYGLYKGMLMTMLRQLPNGIIMFVVYEHAKSLALLVP
uniref:Mitochondrial folate transporter/carrier n=1 Tax=Panagrellus redivivus TaxID=6233 RepID=A0A7E4VWB1_PANRE